MTCNVEYNQLDPLLRATTNPDGDVNDPETGKSIFPGNINQLVLALGPYTQVLERTYTVLSIVLPSFLVCDIPLSLSLSLSLSYPSIAACSHSLI
jgi:hypothetical protein